MITDNPDTNSRPSESPSSRPMTLRQQLHKDVHKVFEAFVEAFVNPEHVQIMKVMQLVDNYSQEIAREARKTSATATAYYAIALLEKGYRTDTNLGAANYKQMMLDFVDELTQKPEETL